MKNTKQAFKLLFKTDFTWYSIFFILILLACAFYLYIGLNDSAMRVSQYSDSPVIQDLANQVYSEQMNFYPIAFVGIFIAIGVIVFINVKRLMFFLKHLNTHRI